MEGGGGGTRNGSPFYGKSGNAGGCGGGGSHSDNATYQGLGGISNINTYINFQSFGNNGGKGRPNYSGNPPTHSTGGGGGAGSIGSDFSYVSGGGNGGQGKDFTTYFGNNVGDNGWFAGGGGGCGMFSGGSRPFGNGGNGLYGGGGAGGASTDTTSFTANNGLQNTGGGGGGGKYGSGTIENGGNGGSGVVIIRYLSSILSTSSIELISGVSSDSNVDYKIGNYGGDFKIISSSSNIDTEYVRITSAGAISNPSGTTSWTTTSDRRIKENIEDASYDKCYDNINNLGLYRFNYIEGINNVNKDIKQLGFIAQEVKEIFPKSVFLNNNYNIPDLLTIDITQINYTLYGAVKKLIELNEDKKKRLKRLETLLNISNYSSNI